MRRQLAAVAAVMAIAATATACNEDTNATGGQSSKPATADKSPGRQGSQPADGGNGKGDKGSEGGVEQRGTAATLKGMKPGEQLDVTFKDWNDKVTTTNQFSRPKPGEKYVAAQFELVNTGTVQYEDSPQNGAKAIDDKGQSYKGTILGSASVSPELEAGLKLPVGQKALGWIVFSVPEKFNAQTMQFGLNSGLASQSAQWSIKK
ncbi:DUF4352 domain-containing protein [Streptomyces olivoreticuli]|uniref:DUF4352 domain-containing protein n=1 Tax=Streptomyces olivoreticuli TaxID=68246 RepID=UPI0013C377BE|nr:DUF4352 domain-containing protein [Streptomyces olivoreticuli]